MSRIRAWAAPKAGARLESFEFDPGPLGAEEVEIAVEHCGICHSDLSMLDNEWGFTAYPFVPGHEAIGRVVAMGPQHATICAQAGMSRADVHARLCELAGRRVRDLKNGGNWRRERALGFPIRVDPDDDDFFIPAIKDPKDLQLIVAGGWGPCTAVCHGWSGGSRAVHGTYET